MACEQIVDQPDVPFEDLRLLPSIDSVRVIAEGSEYERVPVRRELYADSFTTIEAMRALRAASNHVFMLESAEADQRWGRYTFLGCNPVLELTCTNGDLRITQNVADLAGGRSEPIVTHEHVEHPGDAIRKIIAENSTPRVDGFPPFTGGLVGFFSYDYLKYAEPTLRRSDLHHDDFCDVDLMLFNDLVVFDSYRQRVILITGVRTHDIEKSYREAAKRLDKLEDVLRHGKREHFEPLHLERDLELQFSQKEFCHKVEQVKDHIHEGDVFQVVLSNPLTAPATGSLFDTYRVLRCQNPSPYMFYFTSDNVEIAGASPETLARLQDGKLYTYPLAGTRRRGFSEDEDQALERELLSDEKELAEHNMLVDLGRNDLGRVSELGSVHVDSYLNVLRFSKVMHLGSTVSSTIAADKDAVDAIDSILPAGTLSGAPKIRACQIIGELEGSKRGIYGGAIGYLDLSGNMDTCIGIRLAYKKDGVVCVQSGAGIVADSVPVREFLECRNKAQAVVDALYEAQGGLDGEEGR